jgi:hypothetical protein
VGALIHKRLNLYSQRQTQTSSLTVEKHETGIIITNFRKTLKQQNIPSAALANSSHSPNLIVILFCGIILPPRSTLQLQSALANAQLLQALPGQGQELIR